MAPVLDAFYEADHIMGLVAERKRPQDCGCKRCKAYLSRPSPEAEAMRRKLSYGKRVNLIGAKSEREFVIEIGAFCLCIYWTRRQRREG